MIVGIARVIFLYWRSKPTMHISQSESLMDYSLHNLIMVSVSRPWRSRLLYSWQATSTEGLWNSLNSK